MSLKDNQLLAQLKNDIRTSKPLIEACIKFQGKDKAYVEHQKKRYYLKAFDSKKFHLGDKITARIDEVDKRKFATPEKLIKANHNIIYGNIINFKSKKYVQSDNKSILDNILLDDFDLNNTSISDTQVGDYVEAKIISHAFTDGDFKAKIMRVLAKSNESDRAFKVISAKFDLDTIIADKAPLKSNTDLLREDLRNLDSSGLVKNKNMYEFIKDDIDRKIQQLNDNKKYLTEETKKSINKMLNNLKDYEAKSVQVDRLITALLIRLEENDKNFVGKMVGVNTLLSAVEKARKISRQTRRTTSAINSAGNTLHTVIDDTNSNVPSNKQQSEVFTIDQLIG